MQSVATRIYLDPRTIDASPRLHVPAMGIHERMPPGLIRHGGPASGHPYLLMFFHDAAQVFDQQSGAMLPAAGKFIVWDINQLHHYGNTARVWDHSWLHLSGSWVHRILHRDDAVPLGTLLTIRRSDAFANYLSLLYDELHGQVRQDTAMIEGIVGLLWQHLSREVRDTGRPVAPIDPRMDAARQLIESSFASRFDLTTAAEVACLSPSYFCHRFSRQFGVPPGEYVTRLRLRRATQLLMNRDMAVFQVADSVGYKDALYFSRLFRKRHGVSPLQFRKRHETRR
jgi:AraC family transcriptional regulator of arabinose operon